MGDISKSAKAVDGNYDKLSDAEKQQVLKMAGGNVATARREVMFMVHPPNEGNKGRMGPPKGP